LASQSRRPEEIVIVDGGSTDDTLARIKAHSLYEAGLVHLSTVPGANISKGRNEAIRLANSEIIAATDAGVKLDPHWLSELMQPFEAAPDHPDVVSGFFLPDPHTVFETAMGATVLPLSEEINADSFLPSSRSVAFRKAAWRQVGGYPEWLDYCEDLVFDFALLEAEFSFVFRPQALVYFRPRRDLRAFFTQYYRYARGDGKADLWRLRHLIRYGTYLILAPLLLVLGIVNSYWWWALLLIGALAMFRTPYRRLLPMLKDYGLGERLQAMIWVPVIRITGDLAKMLGYPVGLLWRYRHRQTIPD
jgi:glycosyltransferase involved in cell wall biosynthesis